MADPRCCHGNRDGSEHRMFVYGILWRISVFPVPTDHPHPVQKVDDIVGAASCSAAELQAFIDFIANFSPAIKFTYAISDTSVTFLDLKLSVVGDSIKSSLHFKETDSHNYLLYSSSHPPSCKNSIPFSQLLRAKRICSDQQEFKDTSDQMLGFFSERQYPTHVTTTAKQRVQRVDRATALHTSAQRSISERIPLVLPFHPSIHPIRRIILNNFKILTTDPSTKDIFKELPVTAYKRERNLNNHLVRASHPQPPPNFTPGTYSCKRSRCNTCPYVTNDTTTSIQGPKGSFKVKAHFNCTSTNIVYGIICKKCHILYIGETKRRLADRITEHIRSIRINSTGFPVAQHFNAPSICQLNDFSVTGLLHCNGSDYNRLIAENRIIFQLGTLFPLGLNTKFNAFVNSHWL